MKVLDQEKEEWYSDNMDRIAKTVFKESFKSVMLFNDNDVDPTKHSQDIGIAMGQVVLDEVIEISKDMSREELLKWTAELAISSVVNTMNNHPMYKLRIMHELGLPLK